MDGCPTVWCLLEICQVKSNFISKPVYVVYVNVSLPPFFCLLSKLVDHIIVDQCLPESVLLVYKKKEKKMRIMIKVHFESCATFASQCTQMSTEEIIYVTKKHDVLPFMCHKKRKSCGY